MEKASFGEVLRQTRERKGLDLNATARRLRIRPDILQAIEDSNFSAIPPRGYARNMVNGYARYLGLNPTEITGMYLDELYAYQVENETSRMRPTGIEMPESASAARAGRSSGRRTYYESDEKAASRARAEESAERHSARSSRSSARSSSRDRLYPESRTHQARGTVLPQNNYTNFYSGPNPVGFIRTYLPYILAGLAALLILGLVGWLLFGRGGKTEEVEDVPTVPVVGVDTQAVQQPKAPTSFTFEYSVDDGVASWIEVYVDGDIQVGEVVEGPSTRTFSSSDTIQFICANPVGVTAKQDGKEIALEPDEEGVVNITMTFSDILAQWLADHPGVAASSTIPSSSSIQGGVSATTGSAGGTTTASTATTATDGSTQGTTAQDGETLDTGTYQSLEEPAAEQYYEDQSTYYEEPVDQGYVEEYAYTDTTYEEDGTYDADYAQEQ